MSSQDADEPLHRKWSGLCAHSTMSGAGIHCGRKLPRIQDICRFLSFKRTAAAAAAAVTTSIFRFLSFPAACVTRNRKLILCEDAMQVDIRIHYLTWQTPEILWENIFSLCTNPKHIAADSAAIHKHTRAVIGRCRVPQHPLWWLHRVQKLFFNECMCFRAHNSQRRMG